MGLRVMDGDGDGVRLGAGSGGALVELVGRPDAARRPRRSTGLYHLAVLVPSRAEVARAVQRVSQAGWSFVGASDHLVSESLYLSDPEGNGIEIYRDRPRDEWRYADGEIRMATEPLDLDGVMAELEPGEPGPLPPETRIGHVHLQVSDLAAAEAFYHGLLGFDVTVRGYPGALFVSAGGYHHHVGLNTWAGDGTPPPPPGSRGLDRFEVLLPDASHLQAIEQRLEATGAQAHREEEGLLAVDPSDNRVLLRI
jgi:catechol 2,3-dioxygenase